MTADSVDHRLEELERDRCLIELTTTVVGDGDGLDLVLDRELGIGNRLDALDHDRPVPERPEPGDVVPVEALVELREDVTGKADCAGPVFVAEPGDVGERDRLGVDEVPGPGRVQGSVDQGAGSDLGREGESPADIALTTTEHGQIHRDDDGVIT